MTTEDIIIHIFCRVDDQMGDVEKVPQADLYPSEVVTIGILFALKGGHFRAFCRWLKRDYDATVRRFARSHDASTPIAGATISCGSAVGQTRRC